MFQRLLVACERSRYDKEPLAVAARLAQASNGTVILLQKHDADCQQTAVRTAALPHVALERVEFCGALASALRAAAITAQADLLVLSRPACSEPLQWIMGHPVEQVIRRSPVPVLVLPDGGALPVEALQNALPPLRILVPLDGSLSARAALAPAASLITGLAPCGHGALHLLRVLSPVHAEMPERARQQKQEERLERAEAALARTCAYIEAGWEAPAARASHLVVTWSVVCGENVAKVILKAAEHGEGLEQAGISGGCDLIALTMHGDETSACCGLGAVAQRVLRSSTLPVLLVPVADTTHSASRSLDQVMYQPINAQRY